MSEAERTLQGGSADAIRGMADDAVRAAGRATDPGLMAHAGILAAHALVYAVLYGKDGNAVS